MKSYDTLDKCIEHKTNDDFILKQDVLNKQYSLFKLHDIQKFHSKHKCNLFEYVDYKQPLRIHFYIQLNNNEEDINIILEHNIKILEFNDTDLIIIQESDLLYRIIHKYIYIEKYEDLDMFLFKKNLLNVLLFKDEFLSIIYNNDIITYEKYNIEQTLLNNINGLNKLTTDIDLINVYKSSKYIEDIHFNISNTLFIKSSMGSGKSTATVNYIKKNNIDTFLIFSCRRTLTYSIYEKLKANNIHVDNYMSTSNQKIKLSKKLIISPNSIHKINFPLLKFDFIWIDEGVSFMYYLGSHLFIDKSLKTNTIIIIEWLLKNCKKLLITDADLNHNIIQFYLYFRNISYTNYYIYDNLNTTNQYNIIENESDILTNLKNHISTNKNIYICCDTLKKTKFIYDFILNLNIINSNDILLYNSESNTNYDKEMYTVNDFWNKFKVVIVSPKVVFGVDFNISYFDYVYAFYKCTTLTVRECYQQLHRIRNIRMNQLYIHIYKTKTLNLVDNITTIKFNMNTLNIYKLFYKKTQSDIEYILNSLVCIINKLGYKYINMDNYLNYLIIFCIYEKNKNLNHFATIFKEFI